MPEALNVSALILWLLVTLGLFAFMMGLYRLVVRRPPATAQPIRTPESPPARVYRYLSANPELARPAVEKAKLALFNADYANAVTNAVEGLDNLLRQLLRQFDIEDQKLNVSDMAYLLQTKGVKIDLSSTAYRLNNLRLQVLQRQTPHTRRRRLGGLRLQLPGRTSRRNPDLTIAKTMPISSPAFRTLTSVGRHREVSKALCYVEAAVISAIVSTRIRK